MDKSESVQNEVKATRDATKYRKTVASVLYFGCAIAVGFLFVFVWHFSFRTELPDKNVSENVFIVWLVSKALLVTAIAGVTARAMNVATLLLIPLHERDLLMNLSARTKPTEDLKKTPAQEFQVEHVLTQVKDEVRKVAQKLGIPDDAIQTEPSKFKKE